MLCCGGCSVYCRMFSSNSGICSLGANRTTHLWWPKIAPDTARYPWRGWMANKCPLVENRGCIPIDPRSSMNPKQKKSIGNHTKTHHNQIVDNQWKKDLESLQTNKQKTWYRGTKIRTTADFRILRSIRQHQKENLMN